MQVDAFDRHLVNRRLGYRQPLEQCFRARLAFRPQRRSVDMGVDLGEASMIVMVRRVRFVRRVLVLR
jgi:hypothetical protein